MNVIPDAARGFRSFIRIPIRPTASSRFQPPSLRSYATYRRFNNQVSNSNLLHNPSSRKWVGGVLVVSSIFYFSNLEEAPVSGRRRFMWVSKSLEKRIGDYTYAQLIQENRGKILPEYHPVSQRVAKVFKRIIAVSPGDAKELDWRIHIINDPTAPPNAFVLPGGKVFVYSSILDICQNDDGLATVLSHEFAHQLARHTSENLSKTPFYTLVGIVLYTMTGADLLNSLIVNAVFKMPASREMETEADYIGLMLMSEACFNPRESYKLWERMANWERTAVGFRKGPEFLSTHPGTERRINNMHKWLPEAEDRRAQSHCDTYTDFMRWRPEIF